MFQRILIANRGEIALRILRACRAEGIEAVAVYSEADRDACYVDLADEAVCIGPAAASESYLDTNRIISAAEITESDAIHPGYGFLAENQRFAEIVTSCGFTFIGPPADVIGQLGDKSSARKMAVASGCPVIPGSDGIIENEEQALALCEEIGYPVMVKATAGGGGRGLRSAWDPDDLPTQFQAARHEAEASFGNGDVYLEKLLVEPRHVEVQIIADVAGNVVHLGERDCSLQRRHQKLVEESPSPAVDSKMRKAMGDAAVALCKKAGYVNAGTVEFLVDGENNFYFMEMNARIQVEHPVTEMVTGVDIVREQIRIAAGEPLSVAQKDVVVTGHAIECRINAEDTLHGFRPSPGTITRMYHPSGEGVRFDSHAFGGYTISPHYDSMIGKLLVHGKTREAAIRSMSHALDECRIDGIATTIPFHREVMQEPRFIKGNYDTSFIETMGTWAGKDEKETVA